MVAWTNTPGRLLSVDNEFSFATTFSSTIMAELARQDAIDSDKIKADFMSSISHELRTPLHGVLGSVEFLQSTGLDTRQLPLVQTIQTCGRTMLDCINQLLDFAQINRALKSSDQKQPEQSPIKSTDLYRRTLKSGMMRLNGIHDLTIITEEVMNSVFAGYEFQQYGNFGAQSV